MKTSEMLAAVAQANLMDLDQAEEAQRRVRIWRRAQKGAMAEAIADRYYEALRALCRSYEQVRDGAVRLQGRMAQLLAGCPIDSDGEVRNLGSALQLDKAAIRIGVQREALEAMQGLVELLPEA